FDADRLSEACRRAGFAVDTAFELVLPFEISDQGAGVVAHVIGLKKTEAPSAGVDELLKALLPDGEQAAGDTWSGSETEYLMALARAQQHMDTGRLGHAAETLDFAVRHYGRAEDEVKKMLAELKRRMGEVPLVSRGAASGEMVLAEPKNGQTIVATP